MTLKSDQTKRPDTLDADEIDALVTCPGVPCGKPECLYYEQIDEWSWSCNRPPYSALVKIIEACGRERGWWIQ